MAFVTDMPPVVRTFKKAGIVKVEAVGSIFWL